MPYLRLYSNEMTIQQKRLLAQRLTESPFVPCSSGPIRKAYYHPVCPIS